MPVELGPILDQLERRFEIVEEAVHVGQEDFHRASGLEEVCDFQHGDEVAAVWAAGGCGAWRGWLERSGALGGEKRLDKGD